jgi:hypothetical protein
MEYANVGKIQPDYGDGRPPLGDRELMVRFLVAHYACTVRLVGEYNADMMWGEVFTDEYEEFGVSNDNA